MIGCAVGVAYLIWFKPPEYPEGNYIEQLQTIQDSRYRVGKMYDEIKEKHEVWNKVDTVVVSPELDSLHNDFLHRTGFH